MCDIDVKLKPVSHTPYRMPRIAYPVSYPLCNISYQYAEDLGSNPLQIQQSTMIIHDEKNSTDDGNG